MFHKLLVHDLSSSIEADIAFLVEKGIGANMLGSGVDLLTAIGTEHNTFQAERIRGLGQVFGLSSIEKQHIINDTGDWPKIPFNEGERNFSSVYSAWAVHVDAGCLRMASGW
ncbi:MAG: hypothetical protein D3910_12050 [Candidatus Electrothrix sp. ATG2]|nr:hypothetical protein [Candidatus Electrothrix sp. ATG2]